MRGADRFLTRSVVIAVGLAAFLAFPAGVAAGADSKATFGPFASTSPDSGTCGNNWANDTFNREFKVHDNGDGTFSVREDFKDGEFVTVAGSSPGGCEADSHHGALVDAGVTGEFHGYLDGTVTGGNFNPSGCATPANCDTTAGFIANVFGPTAQYSCVSGPGSCTFFFNYHAPHADEQGLLFHHWINASADVGGNRGDIAST